MGGSNLKGTINFLVGIYLSVYYLNYVLYLFYILSSKVPSIFLAYVKALLQRKECIFFLQVFLYYFELHLFNLFYIHCICIYTGCPS